MRVDFGLKLFELCRILGHHVEAEIESRTRSLETGQKESDHVTFYFLNSIIQSCFINSNILCNYMRIHSQQASFFSPDLRPQNPCCFSYPVLCRILRCDFQARYSRNLFFGPRVLNMELWAPNQAWSTLSNHLLLERSVFRMSDQCFEKAMRLSHWEVGIQWTFQIELLKEMTAEWTAHDTLESILLIKWWKSDSAYNYLI